MRAVKVFMLYEHWIREFNQDRRKKVLILTRRIGESLIIGDNEINVKVLGVKGSQVRLGINANEDISVHREEVYCKIKEEKGEGLAEKTIINFVKTKKFKATNLLGNVG